MLPTHGSGFSSACDFDTRRNTQIYHITDVSQNIFMIITFRIIVDVVPSLILIVNED